MRILLAEDEQDLNNILKLRLTDEGYSVDACFDGDTALEYLTCTDYDAAVLDIMMPGLDGFEVLKRARNAGNDTPVLFLTARDAVDDRVRGLDLGASDYLIKPFEMKELLARVRALVRGSRTSASSVLTVGDLTVDLTKHIVKRGDRSIDLSAKEFSLLVYLMHNEGIVLGREKIEDHVCNYDYEGGTNVVDVYISYLRKKIDGGSDKKLIHTVRGSGYVLESE